MPISTFASLCSHSSRLASIRIFGPFRKFSRHIEARMPILMYHSISGGPQQEGNHYFETRTSLRAFESHMEYLFTHNYKVIGIRKALQVLRRSPEAGDGSQNVPYVVLTFDDGFHDFFANALPILNRYGFKATVYLPTRFIGDQRKRFGDHDCLTWTEVSTLRSSGMYFGSHTVSHPQLLDIPKHRVIEELRVSKETIEERLGEPIDSFSYPFAFPEQNSYFKAFLAESLQKCGYANGVSTIVGTAAPNDNPFFLRRIPVNGHDDIPMLEAKLNGGYDWVHVLQRIHKRVRGAVTIRPVCDLTLMNTPSHPENERFSRAGRFSR